MRRQLIVYTLVVIAVAAIIIAINFKLLAGISEQGRSDNAIYVMNADGSGPRRLTEYGNVEKAAWSPDSNRIAFLFRSKGLRAGDDLYVMSADGSRKIKLNGNISGSVMGFDWSPDSSQIVFAIRLTDGFTSGSNQGTYIINADGTNLKKLICDRDVNFMKWSPDGGQIAFRVDNDRRHELYTMSPDCSDINRITDFSSYNSDIIPIFYWSPDGSKIALNLIHVTNELLVIDRNGSDSVKIVSGDELRGIIGWTPDSSKILFLQQNSEEMDIHIIDADGSSEANLTANLDDSITDPMLSPDGGRLLFSSGRNDYSNNEITNLDIYVIDIDRSALVQLTRHQRNNYSNRGAIWSPDGSKILFLTIRNSTVKRSKP